MKYRCARGVHAALSVLLGCWLTLGQEDRVICRAAAPAAAATAGDGNPVLPPTLKGAGANGTATVTSSLFLKVPDMVREELAKGAVPFDVAKTPPTVDLAYHRDLPPVGKNAMWSCWGDICLADDGKVYCGIGDHDQDSAGKANVLIYEYDPSTRTLKKIVDVNAIVPRKGGEPAWSKLHAAITQGTDGKIYFTATLNDGGQAGLPQFKWTEDLPGGQLYQYDPATGKACVFANLPAKRATATVVMDRQHNVWWCNLEVGGNALYALDLATKKVVFQGPDGSMGFNRNFALAKDGSVYFNAPGDAICRADPKTGKVTQTHSAFPNLQPPPKPRPSPKKPAAKSPPKPSAKPPAKPKPPPKPLIGMRASTAETKDGWIYGCAGRPGDPAQLFRYNPSQDKLEMLGPDFLHGLYTSVCVLSPDQRFMYYLPGAHSSAMYCGTPVIQYELATGNRKVIAFLREALASECGYVPAGTYGVKVSADGGTLYVNFNGQPADGKRGIGFGLTAFAAIHIPPSERAEKRQFVPVRAQEPNAPPVFLPASDAPLPHDLSRPEYTPPDCPAWAREKLPAWVQPYVGKNGMSASDRSKPGPLSVGILGMDLYQANHFVVYRPETAKYLYSEYTPLGVNYVKAALPTYEKVSAKYTAGCASDTEKAVALLTKALPVVCKHPVVPPCGRGAAVNRNLDDEALLTSGNGWCSEQARVFIRLCQVNNIPARMIHLFGQNHTVAEFYADGRWAFADGSLFFVVPGRDGKLLSVADCHDGGMGQRCYAEAKAARFRQLLAMTDEELNFSSPQRAAAWRRTYSNFSVDALADQKDIYFGVMNTPLPPLTGRGT